MSLWCFDDHTWHAASALGVQAGDTKLVEGRFLMQCYALAGRIQVKWKQFLRTTNFQT